MIFSRTHLDFRATIHITPKAFYEKFKFRDLDPHMLELQLENGSIRKPYGMVKDIIPKILVIGENFHFHVDFILADMKVTRNLSHVPTLLGRPF